MTEQGAVAVGRAVDSTTPLVVLRTGTVLLAFESRFAQNFAELPREIPLPLTPAHIRGVSMINGRIVPLVDLAQFLAISSETPEGVDRDVHQRVVVVSEGGMTVGIVCDQIRFLTTDDRHVSAPGALLAGRLREFARAQIEHESDVIAVLDLGSVLDAARAGV